MVFLSLSEIAQASLHLTLGFIRLEGQLHLIALTGLESGRNLLVAPDGRWLGGYLPNQLRSYPFMLAKATKDDLVFCIVDSDEYLVEGPSKNPFFAADEKLHPTLQQVLDLLVVSEREKTACNALALELEAAGLITDWEVVVPTSTGSRRISGLYKIDEAALEALDDEAFLKLRKNRLLVLIYCQLLSMQNLSGLIKRAEAAASAVAHMQAASMELDFSRFGG